MTTHLVCGERVYEMIARAAVPGPSEAEKFAVHVELLLSRRDVSDADRFYPAIAFQLMEDMLIEAGLASDAVKDLQMLHAASRGSPGTMAFHFISQESLRLGKEKSIFGKNSTLGLWVAFYWQYS